MCRTDSIRSPGIYNRKGMLTQQNHVPGETLLLQGPLLGPSPLLPLGVLVRLLYVLSELPLALLSLEDPVHQPLDVPFGHEHHVLALPLLGLVQFLSGSSLFCQLFVAILCSAREKLFMTIFTSSYGYLGNECSDQLAKEATTKGDPFFLPKPLS
ncbi:hypothetical protein AVEN_4925-1 [Araneus ventricosus]|uniref:RNase H type-1 domain-containing protein n=1 Tax=Araneus ventricosus TaxID=182803 RepID=A0A4Y2RGG8_ARAVE|nr:hypothetical protein AVEN_4925-1 [Araneus ventricosus]